jgi:hypothetical protein
VTLRIVDADPRADLGYDATTSPRGPRLAAGPTFWKIVEVQGHAPTHAGTSTPAKVNRCASAPLGCGGEDVGILHATGDDPRRRICGRCSGRVNRERIGWATAAEPGAEPRGRR